MGHEEEEKEKEIPENGVGPLEVIEKETIQLEEERDSGFDEMAKEKNDSIGVGCFDFLPIQKEFGEKSNRHPEEFEDGELVQVPVTTLQTNDTLESKLFISNPPQEIGFDLSSQEEKHVHDPFSQVTIYQQHQNQEDHFMEKNEDPSSQGM